jgi:hypothetical protein
LKKVIIVIAIICLFISGCGNKLAPITEDTIVEPNNETDDITTGTKIEIVMNEASDLPATVYFRNPGMGFEYDIVIKDVYIRETTKLEKEKSGSRNYEYIAIIKYSSKAWRSDVGLNPAGLRENAFKFFIGDQIVADKEVLIFSIPEADYKTEDYSEGFLQEYKVYSISKEIAESEYLQLRYVAPGSDKEEFFNIK